MLQKALRPRSLTNMGQAQPNVLISDAQIISLHQEIQIVVHFIQEDVRVAIVILMKMQHIV